jgi:hypothetical protein
MFKKTVLCSTVLALALMGTAQAVTVGYTVTGVAPEYYPGPYTPPDGAPHLVDGLGYPGDSVGLASYAGTLDLTPGIYTQQINTLLWTVSYTYAGTDDDWTNDATVDWVQPLIVVDQLDRYITFDGGTPTLIGQTGSLAINWDNDYLSLLSGSTVSVVVGGYQVDITPLAVAETGASNFDGFPGGTPWVQPSQDVMARFEVTPVPEPISMVMLGGLGAGMAAVRKLRRRK